MEKRLPFALALSILFVMLYLQSMPQPEPAPAGSIGLDGPLPLNSAPALPAQPFASGAGGSTPASPPAFEPSDAPLIEEPLDGAGARTLWTTKGAALERLALLDMHPTRDSTEPLPLIDVLDGQRANLLLRDVGGSYGLDQVNWELERQPGALGDTLVFSHRTRDGLRFTRTVAASDRPYVHDLSVTVTNESGTRVGSLSLVLQSARGLVDLDPSSRFYGQPTAVAAYLDSLGEPQVTTWRDSDLAGEGRSFGPDERLLAAGAMTNYFASVLAPQASTDVRQVLPVSVQDTLKLERLVSEKLPADEREANRWRVELADEVQPAASTDLQFLVLGLEPGASQAFHFELFAGPKSTHLVDPADLAYVKPIIESAYGMWGWINRSLLAVLRFFEGLFGNWGVAIILLTVLVRGALFPLNRKQQTTMARYGAVMQKVKPQLDELKAKHKNNARKFQEEQMKLLKEYGATPPLGGCLLMFLQFPIWISLFQILGTSIELRQSEFVGWIQDLSRPDAMPFGLAGVATVNLLPILMSIATIVQMRFQPKPADPSQAQSQKIMGTVMPLLMLWFLYGYSAGLSLYILTSSLLGIFESRVIRRYWPVDTSPRTVTVVPRAPVRTKKA